MGKHLINEKPILSLFFFCFCYLFHSKIKIFNRWYKWKWNLSNWKWDKNAIELLLRLEYPNRCELYWFFFVVWMGFRVWFDHLCDSCIIYFHCHSIFHLIFQTNQMPWYNKINTLSLSQDLFERTKKKQNISSFLHSHVMLTGYLGIFCFCCCACWLIDTVTIIQFNFKFYFIELLNKTKKKPKTML